MRGEKRFVVTHSEIFPGTFASTTETADWLLGFAGNTAPDHVDHLHAMPELLARLRAR